MCHMTVSENSGNGGAEKKKKRNGYEFSMKLHALVNFRSSKSVFILCIDGLAGFCFSEFSQSSRRKSNADGNESIYKSS